MTFVINVIKWLLWTVEIRTVYTVIGRDYVLSRIYYSVFARHLSTLPANKTLTQCWTNAGPQSATLAQHQTSTVSTPRVCWAAFNPVNTKYYCPLWSVSECFENLRNYKRLSVQINRILPHKIC